MYIVYCVSFDILGKSVEWSGLADIGRSRR
jgi:hypothetical protein